MTEVSSVGSFSQKRAGLVVANAIVVAMVAWLHIHGVIGVYPGGILIIALLGVADFLAIRTAISNNPAIAVNAARTGRRRSISCWLFLVIFSAGLVQVIYGVTVRELSPAVLILAVPIYLVLIWTMVIAVRKPKVGDHA